MMRVDLTNLGTESVGKDKPERARATAANIENGRAAAAPDQAHFSFDHARVQLLKNQVLSQPEVRQQRVDLLRQSLGKGEYSVADTQVADAIIADLTNGSAAQPAG